MSNWSDLPPEIWANVFDAMGRRQDGINASMACKAMNQSWYQSRHWSSINLSLDIDITSENITDLIRMFEKTKWNVHTVFFVIEDGIFPKVFAKKILRNLKKTKILVITFKNSKCVDITAVVKMLPPTLESVSIDAKAGWTINDKIEFPNTLKRIRMTHRIFPNTGHQKPPEGMDLESLEILNSSPFYILKPCCLKSLEKLKHLWLVDTNPFWSVDLPMSKFPVLKSIYMENGSCSLLKDGSELHIIGFAKKPHVRCMARRPWDELLKYFDAEPRGDKNVHVMDEEEYEYVMDFAGQSIFVNDWKTQIFVEINPDRSSIKIEDITEENYSGTESDCNSDSE
jgi:hypothetical protein